jgi:hypothetical protein
VQGKELEHLNVELAEVRKAFPYPHDRLLAGIAVLEGFSDACAFKDKEVWYYNPQPARVAARVHHRHRRVREVTAPPPREAACGWTDPGK